MSCESKNCHRPASHRLKKGENISYLCQEHLPKSNYSLSIEELSQEMIVKVNESQIKKNLKKCKKLVNDTFLKISKIVDESKIQILKSLEEINHEVKFSNLFIPIVRNKEVYQEIKKLIKNKLFEHDQSVNKKYFEVDQNRFRIKPELFNGYLSPECQKALTTNSFYFPIEFRTFFKIFSKSEFSNRKIFIGMEDNEGAGPRYGIEIFADGSVYQGAVVNQGSPSKRKYQGLKIYKNGDYYKGEFSQGERNGQGEFVPADNKASSYRGNWNNDAMHGEGIEIDSKGKEFQVVYENDELYIKNPIMKAPYYPNLPEAQTPKKFIEVELPKIKTIRRSGSMENVVVRWRY